MIGKGGDVESSTITEIEWSERKLDMREQSEGGKPKKESLDIRPQCQTLSKAFEISRSTTKDSSVSQRRGPDIRNVRKEITCRSCLVKAVVVVRWKTVRFKMLEKMGIEKTFKDFGNRSQSNSTVVRRV